jgi:hypothetical protein
VLIFAGRFLKRKSARAPRLAGRACHAFGRSDEASHDCRALPGALSASRTVRSARQGLLYLAQGSLRHPVSRSHRRGGARNRQYVRRRTARTLGDGMRADRHDTVTGTSGGSWTSRGEPPLKQRAALTFKKRDTRGARKAALRRSQLRVLPPGRVAGIGSCLRTVGIAELGPAQCHPDATPWVIPSGAMADSGLLGPDHVPKLNRAYV